MSYCPSDRKLAAYLKDELSAHEHDGIEAHVERCDRCESALERLSDERTHQTVIAASANKTDKVCARFESAWRSGQQPRIEEFVQDRQEPGRRALLGTCQEV